MHIKGRRGVVWRVPSISADGLKIFAGVILLAQTTGATIIQKGIINLGQYTQAELSEAMSKDPQLMVLSGVGSVLQLIGGLAVPVFAFLLAEGFRKTSDYRNYLLSIAFFAIISEIPYDLANSQKFFDWSSQNAMVGLGISLLMLYFIKMFEDKKGLVYRLGELVIVFCAVGWAAILRARYGLCIVLLVAIFYIFRERGFIMTVLGIIASLLGIVAEALYVTCPIAFYLIWLYSGERKDKLPKYAYYIFYPVHLLVLGLAVKLFF